MAKATPTVKTSAAPVVLLTSIQAAAGFNVTDMTIYTWRAGTPTRGKLAHIKGIEGSPRAVRFSETACNEFATRNDLPFNIKAALAGASAAKLGPKPKTVVEKKVAAPVKKVAAKKVVATKPAAKKVVKGKKA